MHWGTFPRRDSNAKVTAALRPHVLFYIFRVAIRPLSHSVGGVVSLRLKPVRNWYGLTARGRYARFAWYEPPIPPMGRGAG